jgi:hypothetical protein
MKKFILIALFTIGMMGATFAQQDAMRRTSSSSSLAADTATNKDTIYLQANCTGATSFTIQADFKYVSGTANGKAYVEYSENGTYWAQYNAADTFHVVPTANNIKTYIHYSPTIAGGYPIQYARVVLINRGTSVVRMVAIRTKR